MTMRTAHPSRLYWTLLVPIVLLSFWLGARNLNTNPVWGDERSSIRDAVGQFDNPLSPLGVWRRVAVGNPWHTPGFFLLLNGWGRVAGWTTLVLRAMPLLFGMLALAWTYRLGRDLLSPRVGLYAAGVLGTSMLFAHYLVKIRMYTLMALLTVFTLWVYLRIVNNRRESSRWLWLGLFAGTLGLLYTHYLATLPLIAIALYHLLVAMPFSRPRPSSLIAHPSVLTPHPSPLSPQHWFSVLGAMALAGILFLPWVGALLSGLGLARDAEDLHAKALTVFEALARLAYLFGNTLPLLPLVAVALAVAAYTVASQRTQRRILQLFFFAFVVLILILLANEALQIMSGGRPRYLMGVYPLLALVTGVGLISLERWLPHRTSALALILWMALGVGMSATRLLSQQLDGFTYVFPIHVIAEDMEGHVQPGDVIVSYLPDDGLSADDHEGIGAFYFSPIGLEYLMLKSDGDPQAAQSAALDLLASRRRVWLAYLPDRAPAALDEFEAALRGEFRYCAALVEQPTLRIALYARVCDR